MPAPTSTPSVPTSNPDDEVADEVKVFSDEGGEPTDEGPINHSSSSQVDIQEEKLGLTSERGDVRLSTLHHERNKHERLRFQHQAESYRQAAIAQNLFGYHNHPASQYGYHHMPSPFGGFSPVASPMGAMQIPRPIAVPATALPLTRFSAPCSPTGISGRGFLPPPDLPAYCYHHHPHGSRMIPSPMTGSPIASPAFLMGNTTTPPPAHMGGSPGSRAVCSPFPSPHGPHFPHVPMYPGSPDWNAWCNSHAQAPHVMYPPNMNSLDFYKAQYYGLQAAHAAAALRSTSPFIGSPTMVPGSPFNPFSRISSPNSHFLGSGFPQHPFIPPSPDGRYSIHGPEVSSSRVSHSSASSSTSSNKDPSERRFGRQSKKDRMSHVKKPLNAFMLFMKENRSEVQAECTLKESAAINQILGKKWHALDRAEQAKYYDMAKRERENHAKNNPGWTAKDNYAQCGKKKRRKKEKSDEPKKCRAIFGIDRQGEWCKPCRRKKKCVRFQQNGAFMANGGDYREPKSSSESISCVSSSMQALSPSADSAASSTSPSSAAASTG